MNCRVEVAGKDVYSLVGITKHVLNDDRSMV